MKNYTSHLINASASVRDGLIAINQLSNLMLNLFVLDDDEHLIGTLTDGDIRRALIKGIQLADSITLAMNSNFNAIQSDQIDTAKIKSYRENGIKLLPILDFEGKIFKVYNLVAKYSILPIDAVLMAGGKGERLKPLTNDTPKPLLLVGYKPIIDHHIDRLLKYGVETIHVTVNYLAEQMESHFAEERDGIKINCIREPEYLGTMGSIKFIKYIHHDDVLVMNSDLFTDIDLGEFYEHFISNKADMSVAAIPYSVSVPYGILELEGKNIKGLREKPTYNYFANGGIYLVKRKLFDLIPVNTFFNATDLIELLIAKNFKVVRFPLIGYWIDIGKPEDYKRAQDFAKHIK